MARRTLTLAVTHSRQAEFMFTSSTRLEEPAPPAAAASPPPAGPRLVSSQDAAAALAGALRLARPLAFIDLETTGVSLTADRIVEIAVVIVHPAGEIVRWTRLVHPGRPIPAEATKIHGIGDDDVRDQPQLSAVAAELAALLEGCDFGGFNVGRFDLPMLSAELARAGVPFDASKARVVDAMTIFHRNERRDLDAAVRFYCRRAHDGAHRALADIEATIESSARSSTAMKPCRER
jgi:DNA polymerase III epsilon subunit-like protein